MVDPFGPLTVREQVNDIARMFEAEYASSYRPVIGRIVKRYGYDIALFVFGQLRNEITPPANIWAYAISKARDKSSYISDANNKAIPFTVGNVLATLDALFLEGKISSEEMDLVKNTEDAKILLEKVTEREGNGPVNNI